MAVNYYPYRLFPIILAFVQIFCSPEWGQGFSQGFTSVGASSSVGKQRLDDILAFLSTQVIPTSDDIILVSGWNASAQNNFILSPRRSHSGTGGIGMLALSSIEQLGKRIQAIRLTVIMSPCILDFLQMVIEVENVLQNVLDKGMLTFILEWPEIVPTEKQIIDVLAHPSMKFSLDSQVFVLFSKRSPENLKLTRYLLELYSIKDEIYRAQTIINTSDAIARGMAIRRADLGGITIAAAFDYSSSVTDPALLETSRDSDGIYHFKRGSSVNIFRDIKQLLNFSEFAQIGKNGTGYGPLLDLFTTGKAQISISRQRFSEALVNSFQILHPTAVQGVQAFCVDSSTQVPGTVYWSVFDVHVWISIILLIGTSVVICNLLRLAIQPIPPAEITTGVWIFGLDTESQGTHFRLVNLILYLAVVVISATFSAKLASQLTIRLSPIQSFEDLIDNDYRFIYSKTSASLGHFGMDLKNFYGNRLGHIDPVDPNFLISRILSNSKTALLTYPTDFHRYYKWHRSSKNLLCTKFSHFEVDTGFISRMGFVIPKHSPFKELFNHKILILTELGLTYRYNKAANRKSVPACFKINHLKEPIEISAIGHALLYFIGGLTTSQIVLLLEKIHYTWSQQHV